MALLEGRLPGSMYLESSWTNAVQEMVRMVLLKDRLPGTMYLGSSWTNAVQKMAGMVLCEWRADYCAMREEIGPAICESLQSARTPA